MMKKLLTTFLLFIFSTPAMALTTVRGTVVDSEGPIPGAYACVKGSNYCDPTDIDGNFKLSYDETKFDNPRIEISSVGYKSQDFEPMDDLGTITLGNIVLDEVVVLDCGGDKANGILKTEYNERLNKCIPVQCVEPEWKLIGRGTNAYCGKIINCDTYKDEFNATAVKQKTSVYPTGDTPSAQYSDFCYPTQCNEPVYKKVGNGENAICQSTVGNSCTVRHAKSASYNDQHVCIVSECNANYEISADGTACNPCSCGTEWNSATKKCVAWTNTACSASTTPKLPTHASAATKECDTNGNVYCKITDCEQHYKKSTDAKSCTGDVGASCEPKYPEHANGGQLVNHNGTIACKPNCDGANYKADWDNNAKTFKCVVKTNREGKSCTNADLTRLKNSGKLDRHATAGSVKTWDESTGTVTSCFITACSNGYEPSQDETKCVPKDRTGANCTTQQLHAQDAHATAGLVKTQDEINGKTIFCEITACSNGYEPYTEQGAPFASACRLSSRVGQKCTAAELQETMHDSHAKEGTISAWDSNASKATACAITKCDNGYEPNSDKTKCVHKNTAGKRCTQQELRAQDTRATSGIVKSQKADGSVDKCEITACSNGYEPSDDKMTCVPKDRTGAKCTTQQLHAQDAHATAGLVKTQDEINGKTIFCEITACSNGYEPYTEPDAPFASSCISNKCSCGEEWDDRAQKCVTWQESGNTECTTNSSPKLPANATKATKECDNGKPVCKISACATNYTLNKTKNTCVNNKGQECTHEDPNVAVATLHRVNGGLVCQIDACKSGYELNKSKTACVERNTPTDEEVAELKENAKNMKEKENSLVNKTIGAVGIGTVGIGGMMAASALSEQAADREAEDAMRAYLETFRCEYGDGKNAHGGDNDVELPGGNDMFNLYAKYAKLANDLKIRKNALGIKPGIESEVVIDKAETNLYDDVGTGITGGHYASVARALTDPNSEDAKRWNEQKNKTADNLKAGAITAGVGAAASLAANLAVNTRKDKQDKTDEILSKYANNKTTFAEKTNTQSAIVNTLSEVTDVSSTEIDTSDVVVNGQVGSLYTAQNDEITVANDETPVIDEETIQCDSTKPLSNDDLSALREVVGTRTGALPFISGIQQDATTSDSQRRKLAELKQLCESKSGTWVEQTNKFNEWYAARRSYANTCIDTSTAQVVNETYQCDDNCKACWEEEYTKYSNYLKSKGLCGTFKTYTCKFAQPDTIASTRCQRIFKNKTGSDIYWTQTMSSDERWKTTSQYKLTDNWGPRNDTDVANNFDACRIYSSSN